MSRLAKRIEERELYYNYSYYIIYIYNIIKFLFQEFCRI